MFDKLGRVEVDEATAGDIAAIVGLEDVDDRRHDQRSERPPRPAARHGRRADDLDGLQHQQLAVRRPRRQVRHQPAPAARLEEELERNVALRVEPIDSSDAFAVSGRGVLHLSVLIETMRREGYELSIGKPHVMLHKNNGVIEEPFESLVVEVPHDKLGPVMELVGARRGQLDRNDAHDNYTYVEFSIPARGLIGLRTRLLNATQGTAVIHHRFESYAPMEGDIPERPNGVLVSMVAGQVNAYALDTLQERSELFVAPGDEVYEGMIVGENSRDDDMAVNPTKEKKLTNMRASGTDENILLKPPRMMSLETALEYIEDDELVEVTPTQHPPPQEDPQRKRPPARIGNAHSGSHSVAAVTFGGAFNSKSYAAISSPLRRYRRPPAITGPFQVLPSIALNRPSSLKPLGSTDARMISPLSDETTTASWSGSNKICP